MKLTRNWALKLLAGFIAVASVTSVMGFASPSPAAQAQPSIALYRSDVFDYFFFYDASEWQIEDRVAEPGSDFVRLSNGEVLVDSWLFDAPGMTAGDCLDLVLDGLASEPAIVAIEALASDGGPPQPNASGDQFGFVELILTFEDTAGRFKYATRDSCYEVVPGQAFLHTAWTVPAEYFNRWQWSSFEQRPWLVRYLPSHELREETRPVPIRDASGTVAGTLVAGFTCEDVLAGAFFVTARGLGGSGDFVVSPTAFTVVYELDGATLASPASAWVYPGSGGSRPLAIPPGEIALLRLEVPGGLYDLFYTPPDGAPILIGQHGGPCAGGGGGNPILIDME